MNNRLYYGKQIYNNGDRFAGNFAIPFLLGGLTGGLLAPNFYQRPYYPPYTVYQPYPVFQYPIFRPYY